MVNLEIVSDREHPLPGWLPADPRSFGRSLWRLNGEIVEIAAVHVDARGEVTAIKIYREMGKEIVVELEGGTFPGVTSEELPTAGHA